jgi:hypothetical protein
MLIHCPLCKAPIVQNVQHTCQTKSGGKCSVFVGSITVKTKGKKS